MNSNQLSIWKVLIIITSLGLTGISSAQEQHPEEKTYQKALEADRQGRFIEAHQHARDAALKGHPKAQSFYGYLLDKADEDVEAEKWYRKSAQQDEIEGMMHLASMQASKGDDKSLSEALQLYQRAAEKGHLKAYRVLAVAHKGGGLGLPKDNQKALQWYQKAAAENDINSMITIAQAYEFGRLGLKADQQKALEIFQQTAELNSTVAVERLLKAYEKGELGLKKDRIQAKLLRVRLKQLSEQN